ncbi:hypothetical protein PilKf_02598 [Pillotina sp. SPG140]|jgi:hypothetical protein
MKEPNEPKYILIIQSQSDTNGYTIDEVKKERLDRMRERLKTIEWLEYKYPDQIFEFMELPHTENLQYAGTLSSFVKHIAELLDKKDCLFIFDGILFIGKWYDIGAFKALYYMARAYGIPCFYEENVSVDRLLESVTYNQMEL